MSIFGHKNIGKHGYSDYDEIVFNLDNTEENSNENAINEDDFKDINEIINQTENKFNYEENNTLLISEKDCKVFLPYSKDDINNYLENFSDRYSTAKEVIDNEFTFSLNYFSNFTLAARFREAFALYKDREGKNTIESLSFAFKVMKMNNLQPAIIAACKSERIFKNYLEHLENNDVTSFPYFKIEYRVTPSV